MEIQLGVLLALTSALISALIWGSTTILARVFLRTRGRLLLNIPRLLISAPFYILILLFYGFPSLTHFVLFIIILSSLAGFVLGDYFFFSAMKFMGVSRSVLIATIVFTLGDSIYPFSICKRNYPLDDIGSLPYHNSSYNHKCKEGRNRIS